MDDFTDQSQSQPNSLLHHSFRAKPRLCHSSYAFLLELSRTRELFRPSHPNLIVASPMHNPSTRDQQKLLQHLASILTPSLSKNLASFPTMRSNMDPDGVRHPAQLRGHGLRQQSL